MRTPPADSPAGRPALSPLAGLIALSVLAWGLAGCAGPSPGKTASTVSAGPAGAESTPQDDAAKLQGRWERGPGPGDAEAARAVKEVKGDRETVTYYNKDGSVIQVATARFRLRANGPARIYAYYDWVVTEGADKGKRTEGPVTYLYRVEPELRCTKSTGCWPTRRRRHSLHSCPGRRVREAGAAEGK